MGGTWTRTLQLTMHSYRTWIGSLKVGHVPAPSELIPGLSELGDIYDAVDQQDRLKDMKYN